jgi:DNA mismatch repair ATPase MutS
VHARAALLRARVHLRADLRAAARALPDAPRLVQKLAARRGGSADLAGLHAALGTWAGLRARVVLERAMEVHERGTLDEDWAALDELVARMEPLEALAGRIEAALQRTGTVLAEADAEAGEEPIGDELSGAGDSVEDTFTIGSPARWQINPEFVVLFWL